MAVGMPRIPNPYGPQPFFGPDGQTLPPPAMQAQLPQQSPFLGFQDVAGAFGDPAAVHEPVQLIQPIEQPDAPPGVGGAPAEQGDYPSEASIERRMKLAKALMEKQQEVNHPMQAVGNAVSQITGAYLENKAAKDQEKIEKRRRDAMRGALGGGETDVNALADRLIASEDPELVEKGLAIKMQIALSKGKKSGGKPTQMIKGDDIVYVDEDGNEIEGYGGPRYKPDSGGSGGGGKRQQGGAFQLPSGDIVAANFNPGDGQYYFQNEQGQMVPVPQGSRPVTPGTGGALSQKDYNKAVKELGEDEEALRRLNGYMKRIGDTNQGWRRWADTISANTKTLMGSGKLTQEELDLMVAKGDLQGLLGLFRVDIVGPGVLTEYDALRLIQALGGDVNALQNPEIVRARLQELYESKLRSAQRNRDVVNRNARTYGDSEVEIQAPERLGGDSQQKQARGSTPLPQGVPPKEKRPKGTRVTKGGKTFEWTGTGWREVQ